MVKKILCPIFAVALMMISMMPAFAASNSEIIAELQKGVTLSTGVSYYPSADQVKAAQNYLSANSFSSAELDTVKSNIVEARAIAKECASASELSMKASNQITSVCDTLGIQVAGPDASGNVVVTGKNGFSFTTSKSSVSKASQPNYSSTSAIKSTGSEVNTTNMIIAISAATVLLAGVMVVVYKKDLVR